MAIYEELLELEWPSEFIIEYVDGNRERLIRGDGVFITPPADDPEGHGALSANLPKKHPRHQQIGRYIRFTELRAIDTPDGRRLWPAIG